MGKPSRGSILRIPLLVAAAAFIASSAPKADEWTVDLNGLFGQKMLKESDWAPIENQTEFGLEMTWGKKDWPIYIATDFFGSTGSDTVAGAKVDGRTAEFGPGVRKIWDARPIRPYVGGGLAFIRIDQKGSVPGGTDKGTDWGTGIWLGGGAFWRLGQHFNAGIAARVSIADTRPLDEKVSTGGTHLGLLLGWGWPARK